MRAVCLTRRRTTILPYCAKLLTVWVFALRTYRRAAFILPLFPKAATKKPLTKWQDLCPRRFYLTKRRQRLKGCRHLFPKRRRRPLRSCRPTVLTLKKRKKPCFPISISRRLKRSDLTESKVRFVRSVRLFPIFMRHRKPTLTT